SNILDPEFSTRHGGPRAWTSLRPESIAVGPPGVPPPASRGDRHHAEGVITSVQYQGAATRLIVDVEGTGLIVAAPAGVSATVGERVRLGWRPESLHPLGGG
ncbi:MAG: TOBE domain-containing protein, partial [Propylenella sp.]